MRKRTGLDMRTSEPIGLRPLIAYSAPALPLSMLLMPLILYLPAYYATSVGLPLAMVGLIFSLARAFDGIIDPLIGHLSDASRGRWGRKPWLLGGAPLLVIATWYLCRPPHGAGLAYLGLWLFLFYLAWSTVQIPYLSWGVELSRDYRQRTRIAGFREGNLLVGTLLATGLPLLLGGGHPNLDTILAVFVGTTAILLPLAVVAAVSLTPAGPAPQPAPPISLIAGIRLVAGNGPFLRLMGAIFAFWLAANIWNACVLLVMEHVLGLDTGTFLLFVLGQFLIGLMALPLVTRLANRIGKHHALALGTLAFFSILLLLLLVPRGQAMIAFLPFALLGLVTPVIWVLPAATAGDAVELGILLSGRDQSALYMAFYNFAQKLALAASIGIALPLLGLLGFDPARGQPMPLIVVGIVLPLLCATAGALLLRGYPITERRHAAIRRRIARVHPHLATSVG